MKAEGNKKMISAREVKELRNLTGAGMMEAKSALSEADGDLARAEEILRKKGTLKAGEKSARATGQGIIDSYIHEGGKIGVLLEVNCETDFVARNEEFEKLVHDLTLHIAASDPLDLSALLQQPFVKDQNITVQDFINQKIAILGENIRVKRFIRYVLGE